MPTLDDFKRWYYEYHCWAAGQPDLNEGFYAFLRKVKEIPYQRLNLAAVVDERTAENAATYGVGKLP